MSLGQKLGLATGAAALATAGYFIGDNLLASFNEHAADPSLQFATKAFASVVGAAGGYYVGHRTMVLPSLKIKWGFIQAGIALVASLALGGLGGYGGYRGV